MYASFCNSCYKRSGHSTPSGTYLLCQSPVHWPLLVIHPKASCLTVAPASRMCAALPERTPSAVHGVISGSGG